MTYKTYSFMALVDGAAKFFEMSCLDRDGAIADIRAIYGDVEVAIYLWREA